MKLAPSPALVVLLAAAVVGGCGGAGAAHQTTTDRNTGINAASEARARSEDTGRSRLVAALKHDLRVRTYAGVSNAYRVPSGWCSIDLMLDSPESVKLYAHAGDSVATNPTETLGVKVEGFVGVSSTECVRAAVRALAHV